MKVLIIEDENDLSDVISTSLTKAGYLVECAHTYQQGLAQLIQYDYECVLLDIMLPDGNGLELMEEIKKMGKEINTIVISAKDSLDDKVYGLNLGADDYLTKPFHIAELTARLHSVIRRKTLNGSQELTFGNLRLDMSDRTAFVGDEALELNRKEFDILSYLMLNKGRLVTKTALAERVWGSYADGVDNYEFMYSQIRNLRRKLHQGHSRAEIQSIYGTGYKIVAL